MFMVGIIVSRVLLDLAVVSDVLLWVPSGGSWLEGTKSSGCKQLTCLVAVKQTDLPMDPPWISMGWSVTMAFANLLKTLEA